MDWPEFDPRDEVRETLRRHRFIWHCLICLPLVYLLVCLAIRAWWFEPNDIKGLWPLRGSSLSALVGAFVVAALAGEALLLMLRGRVDRAILAAGGDWPETLSLLYRRLFFLGAICDTVAILGLILFLMLGDLRFMGLFGGAGMLMYLQVYPREALAGPVGESDLSGKGRKPDA